MTRQFGRLGGTSVLWLTVWLLASTATAESATLPIEEIRVIAFGGCGPWPIPHRLVTTCSYAELEAEHLDAVRTLRAQIISACLACRDGTCRPNDLDARSEEHGGVCGRLFWTPIRVGVLRSRMTVAQEIVVDFTYAISRAGRVRDIEITYLDSELDPGFVLDMIREGAREIEFEPVVHAGAAVEIVGLAGSFSLVAR